MAIEYLIASDVMAPFFSELPMPEYLNGQEERTLLEYIACPNIEQVTEVFRRMNDLYDAINAGRFFLCEAQRQAFPEVYKTPIPSCANDWVRAQFLTSSVQFYNSAFDLYLQVNWIYYELYKYFTKYKNLSSKQLDKILKACKPELILSSKIKRLFNPVIFNAVYTFYNSESFKEIRGLCNSIKHRKRINFKELMNGKHQIYVDLHEYDSHEALLVRTFSSVIDSLKEYHKGITLLCNSSYPHWTFDKNKGVRYV